MHPKVKFTIPHLNKMGWGTWGLFHQSHNQLLASPQWLGSSMWVSRRGHPSVANGANEVGSYLFVICLLFCSTMCSLDMSIWNLSCKEQHGPVRHLVYFPNIWYEVETYFFMVHVSLVIDGSYLKNPCEEHIIPDYTHHNCAQVLRAGWNTFDVQNLS